MGQRILKNRNLKFMMILNLILITFLYGDFLLPSTNITKDKFLISETNVSGVSRWRNRNYQSVENTLEFQSGRSYYIARIPDNLEYAENGIVQINKTLIFSKIKSIASPINKKEIYVSVLSLPEILIAFLLALIITILNFFSTNTALEFLLSFACVFVYFVSVAYFFYLS